MRIGKHTFNCNKVNYSLASEFIGSYLSNTIISFFMFSFLISLIFTIINHPLFWQFLMENKIIFFGILLTSTES